MTPTDFNLVADLLPEPLLLVSRDGVIVAANRSAAKLLGNSRLVGTRLADVAVDRAGDLERYLRSCARSRQRRSGAFALIGRDGELRTYRCHGALSVPQSEGAPRQILLRVLLPRESPLKRFVARKQQEENARFLAEVSRSLATLTGFGSEEDRRSAMDAGFDEHLVKPPSLAMLRSLLTRKPLAPVAR